MASYAYRNNTVFAIGIGTILALILAILILKFLD